MRQCRFSSSHGSEASAAKVAQRAPPGLDICAAQQLAQRGAGGVRLKKAQYLRCSFAGETLARYPEGDSGSFRTFFVHCLIGFKMTGKNFSQLVTMWHDENP